MLAIPRPSTKAKIRAVVTLMRGGISIRKNGVISLPVTTPE